MCALFCIVWGVLCSVGFVCLEDFCWVLFGLVF